MSENPTPEVEPEETPVEPEETPAETAETPAETAETTDTADTAETAEPLEPQTDAAAEGAAEDKLPTPEVTLEQLGPCRRKMHLVASAEIIEVHRDAKYKEIGENAQVPGFRPGRAPRRLLVKRFGKDLDKEIVRDLVVAGFQKAVEDNDIQVVGQPDMNLEKLELPAAGELTFDIEVEVKPSFELPAYKGIPLPRQETEVSDAEVDEQLENLRKRVAMGKNAFEPISAGGVKGEDLLTAEVVGTLTEGGEEFYKDEERSMIVAPGMLILHPTRDETKALEGAKVGETRTVAGHVGPRHEEVDQRGKDATFAITVKEIKRLNLPKVDDEFAKEVGAESMDDLKQRVRENAEQVKSDGARDANREAVRSWLMENTTLELPGEMTEREKERNLVRRKIRLLQQGVPEQVILEQEDELKKTVDEQVERDLKLNFIFERIAAADEVEVGEEEINGIVSAIARQQGRRFARLREEMDQDGRLELLAADVLERKILDQLIDAAEAVDAKPAETAEKKKKTEAPEADEATEDATDAAADDAADTATDDA